MKTYQTKEIKDAINELQNNLALEALTVEKYFSSVDAVKLADAINKHANLRKLNLADCHLGDEVIEALMNQLQYNKSITELNLAANNINHRGVKAIADFVGKNNSLTYLRMAHHDGIGDEEANLLARALVLNKRLICIDLSCTRIGDKGARDIKETLVYNKSLLVVNLAHTPTQELTQSPFHYLQLDDLLKQRVYEWAANLENQLEQKLQTEDTELAVQRKTEQERMTALKIAYANQHSFWLKAQSPRISIAFLMLGLAIYYELFNQSSSIKNISTLIIFMALLKLIVVDGGNAARYCQRKADELSNKTIRFLSSAEMAIAKLGDATIKVANAINELSQTTGEVLVSIQNDHTKLVQGLQGDARLVAQAIDKGIKEGRFKPEANVHIEKIIGQENIGVNACLIM